MSEMGIFFLGSIGPKDHLETNIGLLFKMYRLMVISIEIYFFYKNAFTRFLFYKQHFYKQR